MGELIVIATDLSIDLLVPHSVESDRGWLKEGEWPGYEWGPRWGADGSSSPALLGDRRCFVSGEEIASATSQPSKHCASRKLRKIQLRARKLFLFLRSTAIQNFEIAHSVEKIAVLQLAIGMQRDPIAFARDRRIPPPAAS
jgi:hypothetical protein